MPSEDIQEGVGDIEPGNVLVPVRDYNTRTHLTAVVREVQRRDVVVMTVRVMRGPDAGSEGFQRDELFTDYEPRLFTKVVAVAEREGRPVRLLIVPSVDAFSAIAQTAFRLHASEIVMGESAKISSEEQARTLGEAWDRIEGSRARQVRLVIYAAGGSHRSFSLGVHAPELAAADLDLIHALWLETYKTIGPQVHHRDIVRAALREFAAGLASGARSAILKRLEDSTRA